MLKRKLWSWLSCFLNIIFLFSCSTSHMNKMSDEEYVSTYRTKERTRNPAYFMSLSRKQKANLSEKAISIVHQAVVNTYRTEYKKGYLIEFLTKLEKSIQKGELNDKKKALLYDIEGFIDELNSIDERNDERANRKIDKLANDIKENLIQYDWLGWAVDLAKISAKGLFVTTTFTFLAAGTILLNLMIIFATPTLHYPYAGNLELVDLTEFSPSMDFIFSDSGNKWKRLGIRIEKCRKLCGENKYVITSMKLKRLSGPFVCQLKFYNAINNRPDERLEIAPVMKEIFSKRKVTLDDATRMCMEMASKEELWKNKLTWNDNKSYNKDSSHHYVFWELYHLSMEKYKDKKKKWYKRVKPFLLKSGYMNKHSLKYFNGLEMYRHTSFINLLFDDEGLLLRNI